MVLNTQDVVVINVKPKFIECPLCGGDITEKNMEKTCRKNIEGHDVCNSCYIGLSESYYENGIGCIYCGDKKTKRNTEENIAVINARINNINNNNNNNTHIVVIEQNRNTYGCCDRIMEICCYVFCLAICLIAVVVTLFMLGCIMHSVGNAILHAINGEDHIHKTEVTIRSCAIGYLGWLIVVYIIFTFCLLIDASLSCLSKCYEQKYRPVIVKKMSNCLDCIEKCCPCCWKYNIERFDRAFCQEDCIKTFCCFAAIMAIIVICSWSPNN